MCTADLSMYTFEWLSSDADRPHPKTSAKRRCANWETVDRWAGERMVSFDPVLVRPEGVAGKVHM